MSIAQRLDAVRDTSATLWDRAVAAFYASGVEWGDENRIGKGDIDGLMRTFHDLGVPPELLTATKIAAKVTKEPIVIMAPLLWVAASSGPTPQVIDCVIPPCLMLGEIPSYALDRHTSAGKHSIQRLIRENATIRDVLTAHVPDFHVRDAGYVAAFYADAAPVSRRLDWHGSADVERVGIEFDMVDVGVPLEGVSAILDVFRDNLDHLDAIRAETFGRRRATTV